MWSLPVLGDPLGARRTRRKRLHQPQSACNVLSDVDCSPTKTPLESTHLGDGQTKQIGPDLGSSSPLYRNKSK
ncbi:hypothetical protein DL95DRAFT_28386 [Leptodontidium sp. 2 PMI_412]|nr:hypothetical protein DL95DRAFT_28386 [Leptodontidium sp. 2 PMI_412]